MSRHGADSERPSAKPRSLHRLQGTPPATATINARQWLFRGKPHVAERRELSRNHRAYASSRTRPAANPSVCSTTDSSLALKLQPFTSRKTAARRKPVRLLPSPNG